MTSLAAGSVDPQGPVARSMADLWWLMLALGVAVFVVFAVVLAIALFRPRPPSPSPPGRDLSELIGAWMIGAGVALPLVIIAVVFAATVHAMTRIPTNAPPDALVVDVVGHQWWWEVRYPAEGITTANELHIPVGRSVALRLTSADVIHSFWVPELAGKLDLLPDGVNTLVLRADTAGEHVNRCAEFCGLQHARMAMVVVAEPPEEFASWVVRRQAPAPAPVEASAQRGRDVFAASGCAECHTVQGTPAAATRGPDLTHFASRTTLGASGIPNTTEQRALWVRDPHSIKRGVAMPASTLSDEELAAVVAYLGSLE